MKRLFITFLFIVLLAPAAWAGTKNNVIPSCTLADTASCGVTSGNSSLIRITNSSTTVLGDTITGGGANVVLAWCSSGTCYVAGDDTALSISAATASDTLCTQVLLSSVDPTEAQITPDFLSLLDHAGSVTEDDEDDFITAAVAGTVNSLRCSVDVAPGAGDDWLMTIRVGAAGALADTDVACAISDTLTSCSDTTNDAPYAAGDSITISIDSSTGATDPDAAALLECSMCLGQ